MDSKVPSDETVAAHGDVKSTAIVKFAAVEMPAKYAELHSNTNLKLPPTNWLRQSHGYEALKSTNPGEPDTLSSFQMACNFPDYVGDVDVVSDAENIKKLLKIPFSKSQISMVVHRIGKTILLDDFDVHRYLLRTAEKEWDWLRKFYLEHILQSLSLKEKNLTRKNKSRYCLQNKSMFSKFLYHSVADADEENVCLNKEHTQHRKSPSKSSERAFYVKSPPPVSESSSEDTNYHEYSGGHYFLRDVLWTFEDITMLIGSNMPIFGGGTHPCVSLRLREQNNPINILTGLDYWLDNLMCNVPEVVMCYHLDGIVQKYEFLKTEDIPHMEDSQFSPKLIKDIAQNILSFLKANATKAGHTYWLFKGKDDDVVKLYDLTSLCKDYVTEDKEQNPFAMHVALLLHTVARNLFHQQCTEKKRNAMHFLLKHCLSLLDAVKHPQIVTSSHFLLADLYLVSNEKKNENSQCEKSDDDQLLSCDTSNSDESCISSTVENVPQCESSSVEVESLCIAHKSHPENDNWLDHKVELTGLNSYTLALDHICKGLLCIDESLEELNRNDRHQCTALEEVQRMAKPFQAIPLHYFPLASNCSDTPNLAIGNEKNLYKIPARNAKQECGRNNFMCWISYTHKPNCPLSHIPWQAFNKIQLLKKGAIALSMVSEALIVQNSLLSALRHLRLACLCLEAAQTLLSTYEQDGDDSTQILLTCLCLAGDIHHKLGLLKEYSEQQSFEISSEVEEIITKSVKLIQDYSSYDFAWKLNTSNKEHLQISILCYKEILSMHKTEDEDYWKWQQRLGSTYNELAVNLMLETEITFRDNSVLTESLRSLWKESFYNFSEGLTVFTKIHNVPNLALVTSNLGRLMRLYAHYLRGEESKEFHAEERRYYQKALKYYEKALDILGSEHQFPEVQEKILWEYSTTLFSMANLLQDFAPLSSRAQEDIESEIVKLFLGALNYCNADMPGTKQPLCQYRAATIHQRIASLYHNAIRNETVENSQRHKEYRSKAEEHYSKAGKVFHMMERLPEYLRVLLEHVGLLEFLLKRKSGFTSQSRMLQTMLELLLASTESVIFHLQAKVSVDVKNIPSSKAAIWVPDEEEEEIMKYIHFLVRQVDTVLLKLVNLHARKKNLPQPLQLYQKMYKISSSAHINNLCDALKFFTSGMCKLQSMNQ